MEPVESGAGVRSLGGSLSCPMHALRYSGVSTRRCLSTGPEGPLAVEEEERTLLFKNVREGPHLTGSRGRSRVRAAGQPAQSSW